ncbi:MAG TPA: hypothetical protein VI977_02670 [archaeon]|nr:hypothetical protein [archaeon]
MHKAQVSVEAMVAMIILFFVLLGAIVVIIQKNALAEPFVQESKNFAECSKISEAIMLVQSAEAVTEQTLAIENPIRMEKNNILIGETSCHYLGAVVMPDPPNPDISDATGFDLQNGKIKISKSPGGIISVSQVTE